MKILTHNRNAEKRISDISTWTASAQDKADIRKFLEAYERGEITGRIGTNIPATLERVTEYLKPPFIYINDNKPVCKLQKKDKEIIQNFLTDLLKDKIKGRREKPYSLKVKKLMLSTLVNYLKWRFPDDHLVFTKLLSIRIKDKLPEPEFLPEEEITKLYKACSSSAQRYFISVLFSSGTRAEEFHNIRFSDITLPKGDEVFVKIRIRNDTSKTQGRTISLYYKNCLEAVREYLEERKQEGMLPEDPVYNVLYQTSRNWLRNIGRKVLGKNVHYHLLRSSCATWMTSKLRTKPEYCYFFGWQFSSNMPDVYISRKGIELNQVDEKFKATEFEMLKAQLEKEQFARKESEEKLADMRKEFEKKLAEMPEQLMKKLIQNLRKNKSVAQ